MKTKLLILLVFLYLPSVAQQCPIIPLPNNVEMLKGSLVVSNSTSIRTLSPELASQASYLQQELLKEVNMALAVNNTVEGNSITLVLNKAKQKNPAAYQLDIRSGDIKISAASAEGVFYGINSLLQLIRQAEVKTHNVVISCMTINDAPLYAWRGLLLDESRHFFGKQTVKEILDWMAFYKLNKFHWHLTDSPSWRMEVKAYPLLTLKGAVGNHTDPNAVAQYYTQEDIKEVIAYARQRFIEVIPEVDMPGHAAAANKAYPAFSGGGSKLYPDFTFNPGKDSTYSFLNTILKETDAIFPSQMIHLGGDEVNFGNESWKTDPFIQKMMVQHQLKDLSEVEHYFTRNMADSVYKLNNKVLLWDEAVDAGLPKDKTIIFWWRHDKPDQLKKALDKGFQLVLCPRLPFYLDFVQDSAQHYGRKWQGNYVSLDKLYNFSIDNLPVQSGKRNQILGVQAALWTEMIVSKAKLQYMLFPRLAALAETAWTTKENKGLDGFRDRVKRQVELYKKHDVYYYNPSDPEKTPEPLTAEELNF
jgi:hexosaminidase